MSRSHLSPAIISLVLVLGCAGNPSSPEIQPDFNSTINVGQTQNRYIWGMWDVLIDPETMSAEIVPVRDADFHLNVVRLLEGSPCADCLKIQNIELLPEGNLSVDLTLTHPLPAKPKFTGFDVRGILITDSSYVFPESGRAISWGEGSLRLLNADGYTSLFNPAEFPSGGPGPPALKYIPGLKSIGSDFTATVNPYLAYSQENPRRMFEAGTTESRTAVLNLPDGPIKFGYAVDVNWALGAGEVTDPENDFPPNANCLEAYKVKVANGAGLLPEQGSIVPVSVEVWDHQGLDTISTVTVEAPDIFDGVVALDFSEVTIVGSYLFSGVISNDLAAVVGEYPLLARVKDIEEDYNLGMVDGYGVGKVKVGPPQGWAKTWGGAQGHPTSNGDIGHSVTIDQSENMYVLGWFKGEVDFDPGPDVYIQNSNGEYDSFLSKFDSDGNFIWVRSWEDQPSQCFAVWGYEVTTDVLDNVFITGQFHCTVDFDPGPGVDNHSARQGDVFLCKFNSSGEFIWARTWGGIHGDDGYSVVTDEFGNAFVTGTFRQTVDFDPGEGEDIYKANANGNIFLSKFDTDGNFIWVRVWAEWDVDDGFSVDVDNSGNSYITGYYKNTMDFDPGDEIDDHTSNGGSDVYLVKLDPGGNLLWARTWGGSEWDQGQSVAVHNSDAVYVTGWFTGMVDFDPGYKFDYHFPNPKSNHAVFLSKFDSGGEYIWTRIWDATFAESVTIDDNANVYVTGVFWHKVDFDPGPGIDLHAPGGWYDIYINKLDSSGNFVWCRTWGGPELVIGNSVATNKSGEVFVTGLFQGLVDFDAGAGIDNHSSNGYKDVFLSKFPPDGNW